VPENLTNGRLQAAAPAARSRAMTEIELVVEAARRTSDFARGMVPNGHIAQLEPGALVQDALRLVVHARQVLAAKTRHERARGTDDATIAELVHASSPELAIHLIDAVDPRLDVHSDRIAERLLEIDAWVCRHAEPGDPIPSVQPLADATTHHLT
jgi:hypothetical protein